MLMKKTLLSLFAILMATVAYAGDGTKENPFTIAEVKTNCPTDGSAINDVYVKGYIVGTAKSGSAFAEEPVNSNLFIADSQTETDANNCVPVELKKGSNARTELNLVDHPDNLGKLIVLCGSITKYFSVPGVKSVTEFSLSGESTNPGDSGSGDEGGNEGGDVDLPTTLSNGSFETWTDGVADGWKSASTASNGTVTQSAEAHSGTYAAMLANAKTNKRLASSEIALEAGTYTFSFYVKSASSEISGSLKPGYVPVTKEGESYNVGTYVYGSQFNSITTDWTQISFEFTLNENAIVCLLVMNTKSTDTNTYADLIIDDASLTKKADSGNDDPGTATQTNYIFTKATSLTNGGKYLIGAMVDGVVKVAQNLPSRSTHGYLKVTNATEKDGKIKMSSLEDVYTISGSNIIDSQNRYVYQTGTYNSFNVAADAPEGVDWTITFNGDGTVMITNDDVQKTIQYDAQHDSYGSYDDVHGIYPALYLLTGTEEVTPEPPVETPISTIAAVQAGEVGLYRIQGTVVATSSRGALVYDTTGYIYIFDQAISAAVGDKVDVEGTTSDYGGFKQFSANNKYTMTKTGTVTVTHPAAVELDLDAWAAAPVMQYVKLTGNLAISGNYYNVTVDGKTAVGSLVYPTDEIKAKLTEGEVTVYGYAVYVTTSKGTTYVNVVVTSVNGEDVDPGENETPVSTIAAVQAGEAGLYRIQGTVVATSSRGALVYDTTGYIYIFDQAISAAVGDKVDVEGTTSDYGGFKQFSANNKYTMTKTGTATVTHPAAVELDLDAWAAAPVMQYVKLTGNLAISGNYYNVTVDGKTAVGSLVYPTDEIKAKLTEGEVTVFGYAVYITTSKGTTYVNIITTSVGTDTVVKGIDADQKAQEIYDMTGRRVSRMTKGLYIVGGKKILK